MEAVPTGIYFKSSHYSRSQGQLVENQLVVNQHNLMLSYVNTLGVQYAIANPVATLGFGESISAGKDMLLRTLIIEYLLHMHACILSKLHLLNTCLHQQTCNHRCSG